MEGFLQKLNIFAMDIKKNVSKKQYERFVTDNYYAVYEYCVSNKLDFYELIMKQKFYIDFLESERKIFPVKLVIFDKDGTLIDNNKLFYPVMEEIFNEIKKELEDTKELEDLLGFDRKNKKFRDSSKLSTMTKTELKKNILSYLHIYFEKDKDFKERIIEKINNCEINKKNVHPIGNIKKLFESLKKKGVKIAICTSDSYKNTIVCLKQLNVLEYVNHIICERNSENKPSPKPLQEIMRVLNVSPEETRMIGDTYFDIHSGINARCGGVYSVGKSINLTYSDLHLDRAIDYFIH